jgi:hypothetical protein
MSCSNNTLYIRSMTVESCLLHTIHCCACRRRAKNHKRALDCGASTTADSVASTLTVGTGTAAAIATANANATAAAVAAVAAEAAAAAAAAVETKSTIMLWPQCLEPSTAVTSSSSGVNGSSGSNGAPLEAEVPHQITRLTVVSGTAAESAAAAYSTAGNATSSSGGWVLAGTAQGMLLVYDYSKLRAACSTTQASTTATAAAAALASAAAVVPAAELSLHSGPVTALLCAADGTHCFTASADGCVFVCKLRARRGRKPHRYRLTPPTTNTNSSSSSTITARDAELYDDGHDAKGTTTAVAAAAAVVTAAASTTAAALVLMDAGAARRLREQVLEAVATAEQQSQSTRFSLDRQVQCCCSGCVYSILLVARYSDHCNVCSAAALHVASVMLLHMRQPATQPCTVSVKSIGCVCAVLFGRMKAFLTVCA